MKGDNMDNKEVISEQADKVLEGVEYAINHAVAQVNKSLLPKIKAIVLEIKNGDYSRVNELKAIAVGNTPEGSGPDSNIFLISVQVGNQTEYFGTLLWDFVELIKE